MPTVYVNDNPVEIGTARLNCIQAADRAGVFIPHYCYHEALSVVASCRMCLVEIGERKPDGTVAMQPKVVPGCQTPVKDGTVILTAEYDKRGPAVEPLNYPADYTKGGKPGDRAKKAQADTLEGLLINHPLDCPVCDKAGECKLQDFSYKYGRAESRMVDVKNTPPNKPQLSSKITLFTDRCIMCTRCVRFTREVSGTAELMVTNRGHHEEIDVFPGRPLENKLAGNVVDLCPVGALGSKDFLYKQRVWYLKSADGVCSLCSTGCSVSVDHNKDIVYRVRPREVPNPEAEAKGFFICDEGRYGYHFANTGERLVRPLVKTDGPFKPAAWGQVLPELRKEFAAAAKAGGVVAVLSPFLTVEEAFLLGTYFKGLSANARLVLGPVPVVGDDDRYPKDVKGNPVEPTRFTIRAEKCPNRLGVEAVLRHLQGDVIRFADVAGEPAAAVWFAGGYPVKEWVEAALPTDWTAPALLVAQDLFNTLLTAKAKYVLPATASYEKDGTFVNHAGLAQSFARATRPPVEARSELQLAYDLLGRRGLAQAAAVRVEVAAAVPYFAPLAGPATPNGVRLTQGPDMPPFDLLNTALVIVGLMAFVLGLVAYLILAERKVSAWMQDRLGPNRVGPGGLLQPVADGGKMFLKEEVVPGHVDRVFYILAPMVATGTALLAIAVVPFGSTAAPPDPTPVMFTSKEAPVQRFEAEQKEYRSHFSFAVAPGLDVGILYVFAVGSLAVYGVILAGWSANNKYSLLGSMRSSAQIISYEIPLGMSVLGVVLLVGSLSPEKITEWQRANGWMVFFQPLAFVLFLTAVFAECNRLPFDLPEAEQELVGGYHTEYSSMKLGLLLMAEYVHMTTVSFLMAALFFGGWSLFGVENWVTDPVGAAIVKMLILGGKMLLFVLFFLLVRWTIPRFRFDQLMNLAWKVMIPLALLNLLCVMAVKQAGGPIVLLTAASAVLFFGAGFLSVKLRGSVTNPKRAVRKQPPGLPEGVTYAGR